MAGDAAVFGKLGFLVGSQLTGRIITFLLNVIVARTIGAQVFGYNAVNLYLLNTSVVFLAAEGVRRASQRWDPPAGTSKSVVKQNVVNLGWSSAAFGALFLMPLGLFILTRPTMLPGSLLSNDEVREAGGELEGVSQSMYVLCMSMFGLSACLTLSAEPMYLWNQKRLLLARRAVGESMGLFAKCIVTYVLVTWAEMGRHSLEGGASWFGAVWVWLWRSFPVTHAMQWLYGYGGSAEVPLVRGDVHLFMCACAQLSFSAAYIFSYVRYAWADHKNNEEARGQFFLFTLLPRWRSSKEGASEEMSRCGRWLHDRFIDWQLMCTSMSFVAHSMFKLFLTEGEKGAIMYVSERGIAKQNNAAELGSFSLVSNLGSLVCRMLLFPLEETAYAQFAHSEAADDKKDQQDARTLRLLLKVLLLFTSLFVIFGPGYSHILIDIVYGAQWSLQTDASDVLGAYCLYLLVLACNGVSESFLFAKIPMAQMGPYWGFLTGCSTLFFMLCVWNAWGAVGLVYINCICMGCRVIFALWHASHPKYSTQCGGENTWSWASRAGHLISLIRDVMPRAFVCVTGVLCCVLCRVSLWWQLGNAEMSLWNDGKVAIRAYALHIAVGCVCVATYAFAVWRCSRTDLRAAWRLVRTGEKID